MKYSVALASELKKVIHDSEPLGPVDISDITNEEVLKELFESQNKIYDGFTKHPSIVIGRRGSGKTTFLRSLRYNVNQNKIVIEIPGNKAFEQVVTALCKNSNSLHILAESVAELWDWIFWVSIFNQAKKEYPKTASEILTNIEKTTGFFKNLKPLLNTNNSEIINFLTNVIASREEYSSENLERIKDNTHKILKKEQVEALVLFDSVENYELQKPGMEDAIKGLLKAAGRFNQVRDGVEIRLCLPAELYHKFKLISSNSLKDFRHQLILHWHAGELLTLVAHRYRIYLNLNSSKIDDEKLRLLNHLDIHERQEAIKFWQTILPKEITNSVGIKETPIAYILRHTQLLPRQMILLLNTVIRLHLRNNGSPVKISESALVNGVATAEKEIWQEVCNAYQSVYPDAGEVVRAIVGELKLRFTNSELHKVYVRRVKRTLTNMDLDFHAFKRMAEEIGLIGAVRDQKQRYLEATFEYTEGEELHISTLSDMCFHPLYCGSQGKLAYKDTDIIVYPYGSDPQGEDTRDL